MSLRAHLPRSLSVMAVAAVVAGCGSSGGGPPTQSSTVPATTPIASNVGPLGGGSSKSSAAGSVSRSHSPGVSRGKGLSVSGGSSLKVSRGAGGTVSGGNGTGAVAPPQSTTTTPVDVDTTPTQTTPPPATKTTAPPPTRTTTPPAKHHGTHTTTTVRKVTVTKTKTRTRIRTIVRTITKIKTVDPNVPEGAFMPTHHPVLALRNFTSPGNNVSCVIAANTVRCAAKHRDWTAPKAPRSCKASWGTTLLLQGKVQPTFACGGTSPVSANANVIPNGWDDTVGLLTCQIRSFGVDCFSTSKHGFLISRTGYTIY